MLSESIRQDLRQVRTSVSRLLSGMRTGMFAARPPASSPEPVQINIGCGELVVPGWINLDQHPRKGAYYTHALDGLPFPDAAASRIHCEHFLEHLQFEHARRFLAECHRVLRPGGWLRVIVPDAGRYCEAYVRNDAEFFARLERLGGAAERLATPMQVINQMFRMGGDHLFAWDLETLRQALAGAGFTQVIRSHKGDASRGATIDGDDWWRELESLYVDAVK
jgi:predicted SAM-dependent methyltransferase